MDALLDRLAHARLPAALREAGLRLLDLGLADREPFAGALALASEPGPVGPQELSLDVAQDTIADQIGLGRRVVGLERFDLGRYLFLRSPRTAEPHGRLPLSDFGDPVHGIDDSLASVHLSSSPRRAHPSTFSIALVPLFHALERAS